ncbi:hypothetical protein GLYMA_19G239900v4 [Glycine max]|uniref:Uncharacterized protein n=1 Tax=Glycine max TaxID=3847 RepID=K7N010_SOYBN|nr:hypothetical protein GYH30_054061 [Glycine max]KRG96900.1 hypothetical protein GLYMA_19G239900v4 [Glycine max]
MGRKARTNMRIYTVQKTIKSHLGLSFSIYINIFKIGLVKTLVQGSMIQL